MDVLCLRRVPAVRCVTGKRDGPEFSIWGVNDIRDVLYLYRLFYNDRY